MSRRLITSLALLGFIASQLAVATSHAHCLSLPSTQRCDARPHIHLSGHLHTHVHSHADDGHAHNGHHDGQRHQHLLATEPEQQVAPAPLSGELAWSAGCLACSHHDESVVYLQVEAASASTQAKNRHIGLHDDLLPVCTSIAGSAGIPSRCSLMPLHPHSVQTPGGKLFLTLRQLRI